MGACRFWACGVLAVSLSASASAQTSSPADQEPAAASSRPGFIDTHAHAHRRLPNTVSDVSVGIEVRARDVPGTSAQLAKRSQALLDYLRGEKADRLRTEAVGVDPETAQMPGQPVRITGFVGRATVSFRATPDRLPVLLAGCLDHGANSLDQSGSSPREAEIEAARQDLAAEAARTAMARAMVVAKALGERVAGVEQVDVDPFEGGPVRPMMGMIALAAKSAPTPIATEAGENDVSVRVSLKVRIRP